VPTLSQPVANRQRRRAPPELGGVAEFDRAHWWWLAGAVLLAAWLRLTALGEWSFWVDEAHTWRDATMPLRGEYGFLAEDRALYPLTFLALRGLLAVGLVTGDEYSLRLPFALLGVLSIPVLALSGRRFVGPAAAVLAAWFCAVNPWHIFWSQNARGYVLVCLFAPIAANRAAAWAVSERNRDLFLCLGAIGIGSLCHPTAVLQALGLLTFLWLRRVSDLRAKTLAWIAFVVLAVTWLLPIVLAGWSPFQDFQKSKSDPSIVHFVQTTAYYYRPVLLLAAAVGLLRRKSAGDRGATLLLGCLCIVPFFLLLVVGGQLVKVTARYSICVFPILLWLAAYLCTEIARGLVANVRAVPVGIRSLAALLPALVFLDFTAGTWSYFGTQHGDRGQWRQACEAAKQRAGSRPLHVLTIGDPIVFYYLQPDHYADAAGGNDSSVQVHALTRWDLDGQRESPDLDAAKAIVLHPPGGRNHLLWHQKLAKGRNALFAVIVTLPELLEKDDGELWPTLQREYDLILHLPCFVGPKDESVYVFLPREEGS